MATIHKIEPQLNIAWSWRYKNLLLTLQGGEDCSPKDFASAYVEHDLDITDTHPENKFSSWEFSDYDKEVEDYIQQFRAEKNKVPSAVRTLLEDDQEYAAASMAAKQVEEYRVLRDEVIEQHVANQLSEQPLLIIDALISLARLSFQRRLELMIFRYNETDKTKIKQHRSSISYYNRELTAIIKQIVIIKKQEDKKVALL